jgi:hypothetical protein
VVRIPNPQFPIPHQTCLPASSASSASSAVCPQTRVFTVRVRRSGVSPLSAVVRRRNRPHNAAGRRFHSPANGCPLHSSFIILQSGLKTGIDLIWYKCILSAVSQSTKKDHCQLAATLCPVCCDQAPLLPRPIRTPAMDVRRPRSAKPGPPSLWENVRVWNRGLSQFSRSENGTVPFTVAVRYRTVGLASCLTVGLRSRCRPLRPELPTNLATAKIRLANQHGRVCGGVKDHRQPGDCLDFRARRADFQSVWRKWVAERDHPLQQCPILPALPERGTMPGTVPIFASTKMGLSPSRLPVT